MKVMVSLSAPPTSVSTFVTEPVLASAARMSLSLPELEVDVARCRDGGAERERVVADRRREWSRRW